MGDIFISINLSGVDLCEAYVRGLLTNVRGLLRDVRGLLTDVRGLFEARDR